MHTRASHNFPGSPNKLHYIWSTTSQNKALNILLFKYLSNVHYEFSQLISPFLKRRRKITVSHFKDVETKRKKEADVTRVLETELVWDAARGEGSRIWEKLSQMSMGALHPQLRKQWKLKISRVWSHSVLSPGCSKIRPVSQTQLQLPQEAQAAHASLERWLLLIITGRRSQARGSPAPQHARWSVPARTCSSSAMTEQSKGGVAQMLLLLALTGDFFHTSCPFVW